MANLNKHGLFKFESKKVKHNDSSLCNKSNCKKEADVQLDRFNVKMCIDHYSEYINYGNNAFDRN